MEEWGLKPRQSSGFSAWRLNQLSTKCPAPWCVHFFLTDPSPHQTVKEGVAECTYSHVFGRSCLPALTWPDLQVIQEEQYPWLEDVHDPQGGVWKGAEVEALNDLVRSPQLVTGRSSRNKQAALSILPVNKYPLSPAMPGTISAVKPQIYNTGFKCNCNWLD